jgi:hypothetical protein
MVQRSTSISSPAGARWNDWAHHRAYLVVTSALSGDDHPPDTARTAARMVLLTQRAIGRDGWRGKTTTAVVAVVLKKLDGVWRIDNDQPS